MLFVLTPARDLAIRAGNENFERQSADIPLSALSERAREWLATEAEEFQVREYPGARKKGGVVPPAIDLDAAIADLRERLRWYDKPPAFGVIDAASVSNTIQYVIDQFETDATRFRSLTKKALADLTSRLKSLKPAKWLEFFTAGGRPMEGGRVLTRCEVDRKLADEALKVLPERSLSDLRVALDELHNDVRNGWQDALEKSGVRCLFIAPNNHDVYPMRVHYIGSRNPEPLPIQFEFDIPIGFAPSARVNHGRLTEGSALEAVTRLFQVAQENFRTDAIWFKEGTVHWPDAKRQTPQLLLDDDSAEELLKEALSRAGLTAMDFLGALNREAAVLSKESVRIAKAGVAKANALLSKATDAQRRIDKQEAEVLALIDSQRPDLHLAKRLSAGVLAAEERENLFREHTFAPVSSFNKFVRIDEREFETKQYRMECQTVPKKNLEAQEFADLERVVELMSPSGAKIEAIDHHCRVGRQVIARGALRVEVPFLGRTYTRELALPLVKSAAAKR